ncbi:Glycerophosphoryl diester phosphodiesterase, periplasmic [Pseudomonas syringae pv. atrofaciens]|nr:Glycerophosphoryl diester phosphodiesterase, periplasmic [Pseudomonas syringae pv. atrofaciens]RMN68071.1 Glycerophosphoryl diester phosphodiesterase, periplasmic [Pseudomonas syringae]RMP56253.1 Glycerophosphoryl diester phosphodiesterase, periplasmic [Pseudomonas syringae pv. atrofaciens]
MSCALPFDQQNADLNATRPTCAAPLTLELKKAFPNTPGVHKVDAFAGQTNAQADLAISRVRYGCVQ